MDRRLAFHDELEGLLGSSNVYFQHPENTKMKYPAIVYDLSNILTRYANDGTYKHNAQYEVTYIDEDPDNDMVEKLIHIPLSRFNRHFVVDQLHHYVFIISR